MIKPSLLVLLGLVLTSPALAQSVTLPKSLEGKAVVLAPTDPDYARGDLAGAVKPAGDGGVTAGIVIKMTTDTPVYRLWSGPDVKNAQGYTNRIGSWWGFDKPHGPAQQYRVDYEICNSWNMLTWEAQCTLKKGAVVVIGPGQSVSAATCQVANENYPANPRDFQVYVAKPWARASELDCTSTANDYQVNPQDIAKPIK